MDIRKEMEKLLIHLRKHYSEIAYRGDIHLSENNVTFYIGKVCINDNPDNAYFNFRFNNLDIVHYRKKGFQLYFLDNINIENYDFKKWFKDIYKALPELLEG